MDILGAGQKYKVIAVKEFNHRSLFKHVQI